MWSLVNGRYFMVYRYYNILVDGDRHLRGAIAEMVFERVYRELLKDLYCCRTLMLAKVLRLYRDESLIKGFTDIKTLISDFMNCLNTVRRILGLERYEEFQLSVEELRHKLERHPCIFCLREIKPSFRDIIHIDGDWIDVCDDCLQKMLEKDLITAHRIDYLKNDDFYRGVKNLRRLAVLIEYYEVFELLSKLDRSSRDFLYEIYVGERTSGQHPFDYVCIDTSGNRYLVDVTSVSLDVKPAELSKKEKQIAEKAKERGFKILIPIVKFLNNWVVRIELAEK